MKFTFLSYKYFPLLLSLLISGILTSCDISYSKDSSESSKTVSWRLGDESYKKITKSNNGNEKTLEANQGIQLKEGVISGYTPGLVVKLTENREGSECKAELKEVDGVLKLSVHNDDLIRAFYKDENDWLQDFLSALGEGNKGGSALHATTLAHRNSEYRALLDSVKSIKGPFPSSELKGVLKSVENISLSSSRKEILSLILNKELEEGDHLVVAESIFRNISLSSDKTYLVLKLIKGQDISGAAREYIINNINELSLSSQREEVLMAILKK